MPDPTVVIAGSRALPQGQAARLLIRFLAALPGGSLILMRRGLFTSPGHFEAQVEHVIDLIGLRLEWCQPQPGGRQEVFARDREMVERADLVLTFINAHQIGDEESGTVALADKAMLADKIVYTYALKEAGDEVLVERVGEWDPEARWEQLVPSV